MVQPNLFQLFQPIRRAASETTGAAAAGPALPRATMTAEAVTIVASRAEVRKTKRRMATPRAGESRTDDAVRARCARPAASAIVYHGGSLVTSVPRCRGQAE